VNQNRSKKLFEVLFEQLEQCLANLLASVSAETLGGVKELKAQLDREASQRRRDFAALTSSMVSTPKYFSLLSTHNS